MSRFDIVNRLRNDACSDDDIDEAADTLEFLLSQFRTTSPKMDGQHGYMFAHDWRWVFAKGPNIEDAITNAMIESKKAISD